MAANSKMETEKIVRRIAPGADQNQHGGFAGEHHEGCEQPECAISRAADDVNQANDSAENTGTGEESDQGPGANGC